MSFMNICAVSASLEYIRYSSQNPLRGLTAITNNISRDYHMNYSFARALKEREAYITIPRQYEFRIKKVSRNAEVFTTRPTLGVKKIPCIFKKLFCHLSFVFSTNPCNRFYYFNNIGRFIALPSIRNWGHKRTICL